MRQNSLVLYKNRPARVKGVGKKIEIQELDGKTLHVRPKDVTLLHPGPLQSLSQLEPLPGEVLTAWELLAGGQTTLPELAELIYGVYTPASAWATWQLLDDGLYFQGAPEQIRAQTPQQVAQEQASRQARQSERLAWETFLEHVQSQQITPQDERFLIDVEDLALNRSVQSRTLRQLGRSESTENAHALLLEIGHWDETRNPYPQRLGLPTASLDSDVPSLPDEARVDLTHLPAFAIDDQGTTTPDDALSVQGQRLWVHIADPAALIAPESPIDMQACARGASLHLPTGVLQMLPVKAIAQLGLGLNAVSPALSFGLDLDDEAQVVNLEIVPSWVRVTRLTYEQAERQLDRSPFDTLDRWTQRSQARRQANGAFTFDIPQVRISVEEEQVCIHLIPQLKSRDVVQAAMIMVGQAVAQFALAHDVPMPFAAQEPPENSGQPQSLSEMFAFVRTVRRSQYSSSPAPHAGVGLAAYVQATSPLRRYLDLVAHQQLRAHFSGGPLLDAQQIIARIGAVEAVLNDVRLGERLSNQHWTLVYLRRNPKWRGEGIVIEKRHQTARLLIPELGLETSIRLRADLSLDTCVSLTLRGVDLPQLQAHFSKARSA